jgi:hypothetical protein
MSTPGPSLHASIFVSLEEHQPRTTRGHAVHAGALYLRAVAVQAE